MSCSGNGVYIPVTEKDCCGESAEKHISKGTIPSYTTSSVRMSDTVGSMLRAIENGNDIWLEVTDQGENVQVKATRMGDYLGASYVTRYADGTAYKTHLVGSLSGASGNALVMNVERYNLTNIDELTSITPSENYEVVAKHDEEPKPLFKKFSLRALGNWLLNTFTTMIGGESRSVVEAIEDLGGASPFLTTKCGTSSVSVEDANGGNGQFTVEFEPVARNNKIEKKTVEITVPGKNILEPIAESTTLRGVTFEPQEDGSFHIYGTPDAGSSSVMRTIGSYDGTTGVTYYANGLTGGSASTYWLALEQLVTTPVREKFYDGDYEFVAAADTGYIYFGFELGSPAFDIYVYPMVRAWGDSTFEPYHEPTVYEIETGVYGGSVDTNGEVKSSWNYEELPLTWNISGDPVGGYQVFYKVYSADAPTGDGLFTHGTYGFDPNAPTEEACYYDGTRLWLAVPSTISSVSLLNDYIATQKTNGTPLAICYEVAETTSYVEGETIPLAEGENRFTANGTSVCLTYTYDPSHRFEPKLPDPPSGEGDYMLVAHVGSNTTYEWIPYNDADTTQY